LVGWFWLVGFGWLVLVDWFWLVGLGWLAVTCQSVLLVGLGQIGAWLV
jgi:hypothetical protein